MPLDPRAAFDYLNAASVNDSGSLDIARQIVTEYGIKAGIPRDFDISVPRKRWEPRTWFARLWVWLFGPEYGNRRWLRVTLSESDRLAVMVLEDYHSEDLPLEYLKVGIRLDKLTS